MPSATTAGSDHAKSHNQDDPIRQISSLFPITSPYPNPANDPEIIPSSDIPLEQELLRNSDNLRSWSSYIQHVRQSNLFPNALPDRNLSSVQIRLLGNLSSSSQRLALRRLTSVYERALARFPTSFTLWRDYLELRSSFVLGTPKGGLLSRRRRQIQISRSNLDLGPTLVDNAHHEILQDEYESGLDGILGWIEWRSLAATYERSLMWLPNMPRIWLDYLSLFLHPLCPPTLSHTHARRTFDRALRTLPASLHLRVWKVYLNWAELRGGTTCLKVWRRYLNVDPSLTERYVSILLSQAADQEDEEEEEEDEEAKSKVKRSSSKGSKALEASKFLLSLARKASEGSYVSPEGKSPYQLFIQWLELVEKYPEEIGLSPEEEKEEEEEEGEREKGEEEDPIKTSPQDQANRLSLVPRGKLGGGAGAKRGEPSSSSLLPPKPSFSGGKRGTKNRGETSSKAKSPSFEVDPTDARRVNVSSILRRDGLEKFPDQAGRLWTGLATYWIKRGELDVAKSTFERGMESVVTVRDFTQIFDAYAETSENIISFLMEEISNEGEEDEEEEDEEEERERKEIELDQRMKDFEQLMERRPFLVNQVLLRRNPDDVQEWEKRVALYGEDDEKVIETYRKAIETINPRKATTNFHHLFLNFARFYEQGGSRSDGEEVDEEDEGQKRMVGDLDSARKILEKATKVPFKRVEDLAEIWCEWAEMEVRHSNYDEALRVMARSVSPPKVTKGISYHDEALPPQTRLFKSLKLWSFYVDLEESLGDVESTKKVYDTMLELKIANAQIIINYASFLEENKYFEESFKVYERGVELFTYPVAFEIWNVYLSKFVKRHGGNKIERARDLFEQALEKCPAKFCKPILLMYGKLEEDHGLAKRAMNIYERATRMVSGDDRFDMFTFYIAKATANFGLAATRPIYERAIESLPDKQTAEMCLRFANLERKLGEIDRARAIYSHASQFCDPRTQPNFWKEWNSFEIETGSEDTFREMLRIKRSVQAQFNTDISYIAASAIKASEKASAVEKGQKDAMQRLEEDRQKVTSSSSNQNPLFVPSSSNVQQEVGERKNQEVIGQEEEDEDLL